MKKLENYLKVRRTWDINPRTKVHDTEKDQQNRKNRQNARNKNREALKEYNSSLPLMYIA